MKVSLLLAIISLTAVAGFGQMDGNPQNWCRGGLYTREYDDFRVGTVSGRKGTRSYFFGDDRDECPGRNCQLKAYLVPGDNVIVSHTYNGFVCAWFAPSKGNHTVGWIKADTLDIADPDPAPAIAKWLGEWKYAENDIVITDNKLAGFLNVTGNALWKGLGDNVHIGELDGRFATEGNLLEYSDGDDEYDCKATMRLIGEFLVVSDNMNCGGVNVSFSGVYRRSGS
jgi:hypothetical protein